MLSFSIKRVVLISIFAISIFCTYLYREIVLNKLINFCEWIDSLGFLGYLILGIADMLGVIVCFPFTMIFEIGAGYLFKFTKGALLIAFAKTSGASICFLLGRYYLKDWIELKLKESKTFSSIYNEMKSDTIKLAIVLRLSPIPSWLNNYGLSLTPISFWSYYIITLFAGLPTILQNVYIGSLMHSLTLVASDTENYEISWLKTLVMILSIGAIVLISKYIYKYVNVAIQGSQSNHEMDNVI